MFQRQIEEGTSEEEFDNGMKSMNPKFSAFISYLPVGLAVILIIFLASLNLSKKQCCSHPNRNNPFAKTFETEPTAEQELEPRSEMTSLVEIDFEDDFEPVFVQNHSPDSVSFTSTEASSLEDDVFLDDKSITSITILIY